MVHYDRRARAAGESKYPPRKMLEFAWNGVTSFSVAPLRAITFLGFGVSLACVALAGWAFLVKLTVPGAVPGWASTILPIYFLGGVQLFCVGVVGEYLGKIYLEVKRRPRFLIEQIARQDESGEAVESRQRLRKPAIRGHRSRLPALATMAAARAGRPIPPVTNANAGANS